MSSFHLQDHGLAVAVVRRNLPPARLYEYALQGDQGSCLAASGALSAHSGERTGRSPSDKFIEKHPDSQDDIWWGKVNHPVDTARFLADREQAVAFLNHQPELYVLDAFAGWDPAHQLKVRVICARPYHALFMHNMLIRPTAEQLADFGEPEFVIYAAGGGHADTAWRESDSKTAINLSIERGEMVVLGTEYAGEIKKGIFTLMNYTMPKAGLLSMHCSATADPRTGRSSVLFGLSGTGKTTLSSDPKRMLVGDDEHVWSNTGIFNIEGGCYAKTIDLDPAREPQIHAAIRFGAVLENVAIDPETREPDFTDTSITLNGRVAYPNDFVERIQTPCVAEHPHDVIFLTADAFGVLPPVSRLTPEQAMVHFVAGYTAKVAGTEVGVTEPQATFSPCFGGPFLVWHPSVYAELLAEKLRTHDTHVYLVNTGWTGGPHGTGHRIPLVHTRAIIDAIHDGTLRDAASKPDPVFHMEMITAVPGVPDALLTPRETWAQASAYDAAAAQLAQRFVQHLEPYLDGFADAVRAAVPAAS